MTSTTTCLAGDALRAFAVDGFAVVDHLLNDAEIRELRDTFMTAAKDGPVEELSEMLHHAGGDYASNDPLARWPRMMHPHRHLDKPVGPVAMRYMLHPRVRPILSELMGGEEPVAVQSMFYFKPPGARGQDLHQDNYYLRAKPGTCVAAWVAIDDADEENGGMLCVPNTAKLAIACPEQADAGQFFTTEHVEPPPGLSPRLVPMCAGDVLFFNGNVIHGSYPNRSQTRFRRSFICHYVPAGTAELSKWYRDPMRFDGTVHDIAPNNDGGPCGTAREAKVPH